jgi:cytochrome b pre-mRNA-processing protein 3
MILPLFRRKRRDDTISALYGAIVAQARLPAFYRLYGVPDTVEGRLEMIMLHAALLLRRLNATPEQRALGQQVFDRFCADMDDNLREMGVGDLGVPKHMRRIGEAFYGRTAAYAAALASDDPGALAAALARNVDVTAASAGAERLALYVRRAVAHLGKEAGLADGQLSFPDPEVAD